MGIAFYGKHTERAVNARLKSAVIETEKPYEKPVIARTSFVDPALAEIRRKRRLFDEQMEANRQAYIMRLEEERRSAEQRAAALIASKMHELTEIKVAEIDLEILEARMRVRRGNLQKTIIRFACRRYKVSPSEFRSKSRCRDIALARQCAMYWMRRITGASLPEIGRRLGGLDHTTILYGIRAYRKKRAQMGRYLKPAR